MTRLRLYTDQGKRALDLWLVVEVLNVKRPGYSLSTIAYAWLEDKDRRRVSPKECALDYPQMDGMPIQEFTTLATARLAPYIDRVVKGKEPVRWTL